MKKGRERVYERGVKSCSAYNVKMNTKLTPNIAPIICPIKNIDTIITPLNTSIISKLHLINVWGMAIIIGSVTAVKIIDNAPRMNVE